MSATKIIVTTASISSGSKSHLKLVVFQTSLMQFDFYDDNFIFDWETAEALIETQIVPQLHQPSETGEYVGLSVSSNGYSFSVELDNAAAARVNDKQINIDVNIDALNDYLKHCRLAGYKSA